MTDQQKEDLKNEIDHILESGVNSIRLMDMFELFISRRFKLKALHVKGDDYCALQFEDEFRGKKVAEIMQDLADTRYRMKLIDEACSIELITLNCDIDAFKKLKFIFGDHDDLKTENIYLENQTI